MRNGTDGGRLILSFDIPTDRDGLRRYMRARRSALLAGERIDASLALARVVESRLEASAARKVAAYFAVRGEIDPSALAGQCDRNGQQFYLPMMQHDSQQLVFAPWTMDTQLRRARHGLFEPRVAAELIEPVQAMDWILMPLTAFDRHGNRLGSGGGWYDRTLASLAAQALHARPYLVGLAYAFQETGHIDHQPWDVPLDAIATDREWIDCHPRAS